MDVGDIINITDIDFRVGVGPYTVSAISSAGTHVVTKKAEGLQVGRGHGLIPYRGATAPLDDGQALDSSAALLRIASLEQQAHRDQQRIAELDKRGLEAIRQANVRADREAAKCKYWQDIAIGISSVDASRIADEIMARVERDGAIHRDALIEVVTLHASGLRKA